MTVFLASEDVLQMTWSANAANQLNDHIKEFSSCITKGGPCKPCPNMRTSNIADLLSCKTCNSKLNHADKVSYFAHNMLTIL